MTISLQKDVVKQKYLLGYLFVSLRPLCYFFKGRELYFFHILILHCIVVLVYKIKNDKNNFIIFFILLHEKFLQFDWLRAVVFELNLKYLHVKIINLLRVVV